MPHQSQRAQSGGWAASRKVSTVEIATRLPINLSGLRGLGEVESFKARMDLVLTTRLHGMVFLPAKVSVE